MANFKSVKTPPLQEKFTKWGDTFEFVSKNESNRMYCYRRTTQHGVIYYEVFRSRLKTDENGVVYESYPPTSQFGNIAWCIRDDSNAQRKIEKYMNTPLKQGEK